MLRTSTLRRNCSGERSGAACVEYHYTPMHSSGLNEFNIEISSFERIGLSQPLADAETLHGRMAGLEADRDTSPPYDPDVPRSTYDRWHRQERRPPERQRGDDKLLVLQGLDPGLPCGVHRFHRLRPDHSPV